MRFVIIAVLYPPLLAGLVFGIPLQGPRTISLPAVRDLLGLLGGEANNPSASGGASTVHPAIPTLTPITEGEVLAPLKHWNTGLADTTAPTTSNPSTLPTPTTALTTYKESVVTTLPYPNQPEIITFSSVSTDDGYVADASTTPPAELKQWKVIGIAVITITLIATAVLSVTFFDQWWGFLCAAVCGKRARKGGFGEEKLVPDWKKRSWAFDLSSEDGHRYPTLSSLESIVKEKEKAERLEAGLGRERELGSPQMAYGSCAQRTGI